ncbi:hypothetical protein CTAYLR_001986 [Chrysophaeum taylorii]|uniref:GST C-terminal domain-containing protein n=1 Tax=Chrysophaeum taylorii TaxID=2483200 RepID=A0AAD7U8L1_9STRA|nr:hypothetical protein CTAYLR_001986 [Chrysophaeum taylorii]
MAALSALDEKDDKGRFVRTEATFRDWISKDHPVFKPEAGRYHLVISWACPWANRVACVRKLKGLEDVIGLSVVHPTWQRTKPDVDAHAGWAFATEDQVFASPNGSGKFQLKGVIPLPDDVVPGAKFVRDVYEATGNDPKKYTVPLLWDKLTKTIVNNESSDLIVMLNSAFNDLAKNPDLDLDPPETRDAQADLNSWIYPTINNGVYRAGFAKSQFAYEEAVTELFASLAKLEAHLADNRFLCGPKLTLADIRLFMTLVRFDEVYIVYFKCNIKALTDFPNINNYCRDVYQFPGVADVIKMDHIKTHYFTSHPTLNHYAVVPVGPGFVEDLKLPHNRAAL